MDIKWIEVDELEHTGHGVEFYHHDCRKRRQLIAFLEGYEWRDGGAATVFVLTSEAEIFKQGSVDSRTLIDETKKCIEDFLNDEKLQKHGKVTEKISAWFNG